MRQLVKQLEQFGRLERVERLEQQLGLRRQQGHHRLPAVRP
jgi:hypothetical protein